MQFSAALVALFASVAFAASPAMVSGGADAKATGAPDAAMGIPDALKQCAAKCADQKDAVADALDCLKKNCGKDLGSMTAGGGAKATGAADAPGADVDAGVKAAIPPGLLKCASKCANKKKALDKAFKCLKKNCASALGPQKTAPGRAKATAGASADPAGALGGN